MIEHILTLSLYMVHLYFNFKDEFYGQNDKFYQFLQWDLTLFFSVLIISILEDYNFFQLTIILLKYLSCRPQFHFNSIKYLIWLFVMLHLVNELAKCLCYWKEKLVRILKLRKEDCPVSWCSKSLTSHLQNVLF